jgi:hypothetical protein
MRLALSIAILGLASQSIAQQVVIPAHTTIYNGYSRGYSTVAATNFDINLMELPVDAYQTGDTGSFLIQVNGVDVFHDFGGTAAIVNVIPPVTVLTGDIVMVVGNWSPVVTSNFSAHNSYAGGAGPYATTILGVAHTLDRAGYQCDIGDPTSYAAAASFNSIAGSLGRVWIDVSPPGGGGGGGSIALADTVGDGCINQYASMYQTTTLDAFALANTMTGIDYINTGAGYIVTTAAGTFVPVGTVDPLTVPVPGVGDDAVVPAGTLGLEFGSNGWLALGTGNSNAWSPTPAVFLGQPAAQFSFWSDFQPNTGGDINFEEAGTRTLLTYTDVLAWGTSDLNTFQFDYDSATGNCSMYLGALASATAHPTMIGYSPAGPNLNPGSTDIETTLSTAGAIIIDGSDIAPLSLAGIGRPIMGAAPTPYQATTSNIDAGALFHAGLLGLTNPSTPLSIIGFPAGCTLYSSADVLVGPDVVAGGPGSLTWTVLGLPIANAAFNGVELYVAAATLDLSLISATSRSSNGIKLTLGDS